MKLPIPLSRKKLLIPALLVALLLAGWYAGARMVPDRALALLARHGFTNVKTGATGFHGDSFSLSDIELDPGAFSTIRALRVQPDWSGLFGGRFIGGLIIDDMRLMGEWTGRGFDIVGWQRRMPPFPRQDSIIINGLRLDMDTPYGALRLETKGRLTRERDGDYKIDGVLYGRQHQLTIDSRWTGALSPNGAFGLESEIVEANIRTEHLELSRGSGWLQLSSELAEDGRSITPLIAGQIQAGRLSYNDIPLGNVTVTMDGRLLSPHVILSADIGGLPGMRINADLRPDGLSWTLAAEITTPELNDMLAFMIMLRQNMETHKDSALTSFLLTQGNVERLRKQVQGMTYDELELKIEGPTANLHGSLIAKTKAPDGSFTRTAISLDPATR